MRRPVAAVAVSLSLAASVLTAGVSAATDDPVSATASDPIPGATAPDPQEVLEQAEAVLLGEQAAEPEPEVEATIVLRDLFAALPRLTGADRRRAEMLLARPTQGKKDPFGDGYSARAVKTCNKKLCVHRVERTSDQATKRWARKTLRTVTRVWTQQVGSMGYRRPLQDGRRGGNKKFDVYLVDVGADGLYGYCAPERTKRGYRRLASGYCVLDNDFAKAQFGGVEPIDSLRVTAAHEFFHAVQFAYDYLEDPWLMEASSTWMEERFADDVDDNRQYLQHGQVRATRVPLDTFDRDGFMQYGNWAFFEYLSQRFGNRALRRIWTQAGHFEGDGKKYSTNAVKAVLPAPFKKVYTQFAAANATPARSYPEGSSWPTPRLAGRKTVGQNKKASGSVRIDHMASAHFVVLPGEALTQRRWKLRVRVDGPGKKSSPMAAVVRVAKSGTITRKLVPLDKDGVGSAVVPFNLRQTERVHIVAVNGSTRFDCAGRYVVRYSCGGKPKDDNRRFQVSARTFAAG